jgi:hypothetical protein
MSVSVLGVQDKVADDVDGALNVRVTPTVFVSPPPVTVMVAVFVPTAAVAVFTLTVMLPLLEDDAGLTVIQLTLSETLQVVFDVTASV